MADQSNVSSTVHEKISEIDEASAWLSKAGYKNALYELITNIEHEVSQKHTLSPETFDRNYRAGREAYSNGEPFLNYRKKTGQLRKAWRAGWLFEASENALLIKANEQILLHAQEYLEATTVAKNQIKHLAKSAVHSKHRHELSRCISMMNHLTSSLETIVNNKPNETSNSQIQKAEAVSYG